MYAAQQGRVWGPRVAQEAATALTAGQLAPQTQTLHDGHTQARHTHALASHRHRTLEVFAHILAVADLRSNLGKAI